MFSILLGSFLIFITLWAVAIATQKFADSLENIAIMKEINKEISKWDRVTATVIEYGYDIIQAKQLEEETQKDKAVAETGTLITYQFIDKDGVLKISSDITPLLSDKDRKLLFKLKKKCSISVFVDPEASERSYIKAASSKAINDWSSIIISQSIRHYLLCLVPLTLAILAFYFDSPL
jgi:neutral trehalase